MSHYRLWLVGLSVGLVVAGCDVLAGLDEYRQAERPTSSAATTAAGPGPSGGGGASSTSVGSGAGRPGGGGGTAPLAVAEQLLVDLRVEQWPAQGMPWPNSGGALKGEFVPVGDADPREGFPDSIRAACFNGVSAFEGPVTPPTIEGGDSRSVEVWVHNSEYKHEETMVSWGHRGVNNRLMSFNYGHNDTYGAAGHYGSSDDLGWNPEPDPQVWHLLTYVYDGQRAQVFLDGQQNSFLDTQAIDTIPDQPILLGAQWLEPDTLELGQEIGAELCVARVRIHAGALTPEQIELNFALERGDFNR